jgi:hypothetical protein
MPIESKLPRVGRDDGFLRDSFNDDDSEHRPAKMDVISANAPSVKRIEVDFS